MSIPSFPRLNFVFGPFHSSRHSDKPTAKNVTPTKTLVAIAQSQHCACEPVDHASLGTTLVSTSSRSGVNSLPPFAKAPTSLPKTLHYISAPFPQSVTFQEKWKSEKKGLELRNTAMNPCNGALQLHPTPKLPKFKQISECRPFSFGFSPTQPTFPPSTFRP